LTSLSLAVQGESSGQLQQRAFFDVENEQFFLGSMTRTVEKRVTNGDPTLVPLSDIIPPSFSGDSVVLKAIEEIIQGLKERSKLGKSELVYRERLHKVARMLQREVPCEEFCDDHEENAFELFSRLNKGGTSLSVGEVAAARLASAATRKIVEPMRQLVAEQEMRALGFNFVFVLRTLVTVHRGNASFSKLPQNWAADTGKIEESWRSTERALKATVQFLKEEVGWTTRRWLPSTMALIPIAYFLATTNSEVDPKNWTG
jgi:hypothetical protein